jgi:tRNA U34 2-thiouridine synthase MnmA/TrmU
VTLVRGTHVLDAARVGAREIAAELGGLSPAKLHAAEVAADALARALGAAVRERGELERPASGQRSLVAMSGGVDSAVAALRCAQAGETVAVTLELWADAENDAERSCCSATAVAQARSLAHSMGLPHFTIDLRREFRDQTYMLAALSPRSLARMRFPLGDLTKPEVRELAAAAGLPVAAKADSQDLCFMAGTDRGRFLARHGGLGDRLGPIVDQEGRVLGRHRGQHRFTVGQRKGLGIASGEPLYVVDKDAQSNRVVVGPREALQSSRVTLRNARLRRDGSRVDRVKLRYRSRPLAARVVEAASGGLQPSLTLELTDAADVAAPGQMACLMDGELVIGWGTITRPRPAQALAS